MSDYEKLKKIIAETSNLISMNIKSSDPDFKAWHKKVERFISSKYGDDSNEIKDFNNMHFASLSWFGSPTKEEAERVAVEKCREGLQSAKAILEVYLEELSEEERSEPQSQSTAENDKTKIFIVHGHNGEMKHLVARIIEKQGIEAIILSEQSNGGRTIIEKIEEYSDVGCAVCLFTADDIGRVKMDSADKKEDSPEEIFRARQNVVFETGYFIGKLGRDNVIILSEKGIEIPNDLSGVVYTDTSKCELDLIKELKAIGYKVDANKLL